MDTTAEVQRGAERGRSEECVGGRSSVGGRGWLEGVAPCVTVLAKGTVGHWGRRARCPCRQPGLEVGSLVFPVAFLRRQTGAVDGAPARTERVRVRAS